MAHKMKLSFSKTKLSQSKNRGSRFLLRRDRKHIVFVNPLDTPGGLGLEPDQDARRQLVPNLRPFFTRGSDGIGRPNPANNLPSTPPSNSTAAIQVICGSHWHTKAQWQNTVQGPTVLIVSLQPTQFFFAQIGLLTQSHA